MSDITIHLGKRIRMLRQSRGWTQERLAEYADLHVSYIVLLEKGANRATIETLHKLAQAFDISISELVRSIDGETPVETCDQLRNMLEDFVQKIDALYTK